MNPMTTLEAAILFISKGWSVLPVHSVNIYGKCSCGAQIDYDPNYLPKHAIGKHPYLGEFGHRESSKDESIIRQWWHEWPEANISIATGRKSNLVVLDIDKKNGGLESLKYLENHYGRLPVTPKVNSGGGGLHLYFKHPGFEMRGRRDMLPGIDVMADGGRIVAPPSKHKSGKKYEWDLYENHNLLPAQLPVWLKDLIMSKQSKRREPTVIKTHIEPPKPVEKKSYPIRYVVTYDDY